MGLSYTEKSACQTQRGNNNADRVAILPEYSFERQWSPGAQRRGGRKNKPMMYLSIRDRMSSHVPIANVVQAETSGVTFLNPYTELFIYEQELIFLPPYVFLLEFLLFYFKNTVRFL